MGSGAGGAYFYGTPCIFFRVHLVMAASVRSCDSGNDLHPLYWCPTFRTFWNKPKLCSDVFVFNPKYFEFTFRARGINISQIGLWTNYLTNLLVGLTVSIIIVHVFMSVCNVIFCQQIVAAPSIRRSRRGPRHLYTRSM